MLDAKIISHYMQVGRRQLQRVVSLLQGIAVEVSPIVAVPLVQGFGADHLRQIGAIHFADAARLEDKFLGIRFERGDDATQRTMGAQVANDSTGIDFRDHGNVEAFEVFLGHLLRAPVGAYG